MWRDFWNGIGRENPVFGLVLGLCPTLATTTAMENGLWMGLAVIFVLTCSNALISLLAPVIPSQVRIPCFIVVIATFVTLVDMVMHAFIPAMYQILGIFIPLIVVNCIILGRAEAFASKKPLLNSIADGVGMGLGFTGSLMLIGGIREVIGTGGLTLFGNSLFHLGAGYHPALSFILPPGAFLTMGLLLGGFNALGSWRAQRRRG
ncbi:MAG TPA: electron transport complex subunit E [Firmicutes bacterium]|nr:electron transport complex subunit E [Bacillota bacterium]